MKIAVEGCCHGCLDKIYEVLTTTEQREGYKIDLLICCGDFQAVRNDEDLCCMAVPPKYRHMETFYKYYSGEKKAPILTLFIGGNHEASNHLWELSYGGWVAPNIYYLGNAGVVKFGGLRIAGISGIYKPGDFNMSRYEQPPYNQGTMRSAYHVRSCDVFRLKQLSGHVDIMLSHDWPQGIYHYGNKEQLIRIKPHFAEEISRDSLGSPPAMDLLDKLKPSYWFSAHLHVKFAALYPHDKGHTKFLALDKCLPRRQFLQILDIPTPGCVNVATPYKLEYDAEWLGILSLSEPLMKYTHSHWSTPSPLTHQRWQFTPTAEELDNVIETFGDLTLPENFVATVTPYSEGARINNRAVAAARENCQTTEFCKRLGITNPFCPPQPLDDGSEAVDSRNPEEINLESSDSDGETSNQGGATNANAKVDQSATVVGRTEEGVVWSVDTRPGLCLPQPTMSHDDHVTTQTAVEAQEKENEEKCQDMTPVDSNDNQESIDKVDADRSQEHSTEQRGRGVVIKRRNQAMYDEPGEENLT